MIDVVIAVQSKRWGPIIREKCEDVSRWRWAGVFCGTAIVSGFRATLPVPSALITGPPLTRKTEGGVRSGGSFAVEPELPADTDLSRRTALDPGCVKSAFPLGQDPERR